ncbi:MAG: cytidylate kinase-like family protein [Chloroflexota bacterium]|jgi:cytidylate kinase
MAVITISRQAGSGGDEIAERVCDLLGYRYFDKQMMVEAAAAAGLCEAEVVDYSEDHYKVQDFLSRLLRSRPRTVRQVLIREDAHKLIDTLTARELDEARCVDLIRYAIISAYEQGDMVIVGRGGQAVLRHKPGVLHVRVIAPLEERILRLREQGVSGVSELKLTIADRDRASAEYLKRYFNISWDDPALYHMILNTDLLDLDAAAGIIASAVQHLAPAAAA